MIFVLQIMRALIFLLFLALVAGQNPDMFGGDNFISGGQKFSSDFNNGFDQMGNAGGFPADFIGSPARGLGPSANDFGLDNTGLGVSVFDGNSPGMSGSWGSQGSGFSSWDNGGFESNIGQPEIFGGGGSAWNNIDNGNSRFSSGGLNDVSFRDSSKPRFGSGGFNDMSFRDNGPQRFRPRGFTDPQSRPSIRRRGRRKPRY